VKEEKRSKNKGERCRGIYYASGGGEGGARHEKKEKIKIFNNFLIKDIKDI